MRYVEWLAQQVSPQRIDATIILGDLSDAKDHHAGQFVNNVVDRLVSLADMAPLHILFGNHDGPSPDRPFWRFLDQLQNIDYYTLFTITAPLVMVPFGAESALLSWVNAPYDRAQYPGYYVFMHATVNGARVENGTTLTNDALLPARFLPKGFKGRVFSGDVHVPQTIGDVEYVGTPYHIHYGDGFDPRTLVFDTKTGKLTALRYPDAPRLITLRMDPCTEFEFENLLENDRVKLVGVPSVELLPQDWQAYVREARQVLDAHGITLASAVLERRKETGLLPAAPTAHRSDEAIVRTYAQRMRYDAEVTAAGVELVK